MSNKPIKVYKKGKMQLAIWKGDYQGNPTISFSLKKNYYDKETKAWKESNYLSITDLADINFLTQTVITNNINNSADKNQASGLQQPQYQQSGKQFLDKHKEDQNNLHFDPDEDLENIPF